MRTFILLMTAAALVAAEGSSHAHPQAIQAHPQAMVVPSSLSIRGEYFDASVDGLRGYLETIRSTDPDLYTKLDPKLSNLEWRRTAAVLVAVAAVGIGLGSMIYAFAARKSCNSPPVNDPNFSADVNAWANCNDDSMRTMATFSLVGLGTLTTGLFAAAFITPGRSDIFDIVNEHNRLRREPLRWQLGYEPTRRTAVVGASLAF